MADASIVKPISRKAGGGGRKAQFFLFLIFSAVGVILFYFLFLRTVSLVIKSKSWPETPCKIIDSRVGTHSSSDGTTYSVDIRYSYWLKGHPYESDRYDFMRCSSSGRSGKEAVVRRYPAGSTAICFVNPENPKQSVLCREFRNTYLLGLAPLIFAFVGAGGLILTLRKKNASISGLGRNITWIPDVSRGRTYGTVDTTAWDARRPAILESRGSVVKRMALAIALSLIFDAVALFMIISLSHGSHHGGFDPGLVALIVVIGVTGIVLLAVAGYCGLSAFNPRPRILLSTDRVPVGGRIDLKWQIIGRADKLKSLRLWLEGREEATYRSGKNTATARSVFAEMNIVNTSDPDSIRTGTAEMNIPLETMHSFSSNYNRVRWTIKVRGSIDRWPDMVGSFEILLVPARAL